MYIYSLISCIYIGWLFSFFPQIIKDEFNREDFIKDSKNNKEEKDEKEEYDLNKEEKEYELEVMSEFEIVESNKEKFD